LRILGQIAIGGRSLRGGPMVVRTHLTTDEQAGD
jgi:hypothetical protein